MLLYCCCKQIIIFYFTLSWVLAPGPRERSFGRCHISACREWHRRHPVKTPRATFRGDYPIGICDSITSKLAFQPLWQSWLRLQTDRTRLSDSLVLFTTRSRPASASAIIPTAPDASNLVIRVSYFSKISSPNMSAHAFRASSTARIKLKKIRSGVSHWENFQFVVYTVSVQKQWSLQTGYIKSSGVSSVIANNRGGHGSHHGLPLQSEHDGILHL